MNSGSAFHGAASSLTRFFSRKSKGDIPPKLSHPVRYPFGEFEMQIHATPGQSLELQTSRDFKHWETLATLTAAKETTVHSDQKAGVSAALFYRVVSGNFTSNCLGFVTIDIPPGYSMISNPLHCASNQIGALFPQMPEETTISKFSVITFSLIQNKFGPKGWSSPSETLSPGEGSLIFNPTDGILTARFLGEVSSGTNTLPIHSGTTMRSSMIPLAGRLDVDLGFPIAPGDVVSLYSNHNEKYLEYRYAEKGWAGEGPLLRMGEAFWIAKNASTVWTQKLPG